MHNIILVSEKTASGRPVIKYLYLFYKLISTHLLTALTNGAITRVEQRNREDLDKTKTLLPLLIKLINHSF